MAILIPRKKDYWRRNSPAESAVNWGHSLLEGGGAVWLFHNKSAPENHSFSDPSYENQLSVESGSPVPTNLGMEFGAGSDYVSADISSFWDISATYGIVSDGPVPLTFNLLTMADGTSPTRYIRFGTNGYDVRNGGSRGLYTGGVAHEGGDSLNLSLVFEGTASQKLYRNGAFEASTTNNVANASCDSFTINSMLDSSPVDGVVWTCAMAYYLRAPLDSEQIASLHENPYQILKPRRKYWVLPTAAGGTTVTPPTGAITYTGFAPTVTATDNQIVDVPVGAVTLTGYAPTVTIGDAVEVEIPAGAITYTGLAPTVTASDNQSIEVATGSVSYTGFAPTVTVGNPVEITVPTGAVSYAGDVPTVTTTENQVIEVSTGAVTYTGLAPSVLISDPQLVDIPVGAIAYTGYAPTVTIGAIQTPDCFEVLSSHIDEDGVTVSSAIVAELALNGIINSNGQSLSSKITSSISLSSPICSH